MRVMSARVHVSLVVGAEPIGSRSVGLFVSFRHRQPVDVDTDTDRRSVAALQYRHRASVSAVDLLEDVFAGTRGSGPFPPGREFVVVRDAHAIGGERVPTDEEVVELARLEFIHEP
jgi:hypothetical protein